MVARVVATNPLVLVDWRRRTKSANPATLAGRHVAFQLGPRRRRWSAPLTHLATGPVRPVTKISEAMVFWELGPQDQD